MHLKEFQDRARKADQTRPEGTNSDPQTPTRHEVVPLLGLVGEVGGLLGEYKKRLRDGETHRSFPEEVAEELGDILWYVANVADKFGLELETIAADNLRKVSDRWLRPEGNSASVRRRVARPTATAPDVRVPVRGADGEWGVQGRDGGRAAQRRHRQPANGQRETTTTDTASTTSCTWRSLHCSVGRLCSGSC